MIERPPYFSLLRLFLGLKSLRRGFGFHFFVEIFPTWRDLVVIFADYRFKQRNVGGCCRGLYIPMNCLNSPDFSGFYLDVSRLFRVA